MGLLSVKGGLIVKDVASNPTQSGNDREYLGTVTCRGTTFVILRPLRPGGQAAAFRCKPGAGYRPVTDAALQGEILRRFRQLNGSAEPSAPAASRVGCA